MRLVTCSGAFLALATLAPAVNALPSFGWGQNQPREDAVTAYGGNDISKLAKYLPSSNLPKPDGLELKFVGLGIGTQNYTCNGDKSAAPGTTGALATLYDMGSGLANDPMAAWKLASVTGLALSLYNYHESLMWYLNSQGYQDVLGHHFFTPGTPSSVPTFLISKIQQNPPVAYVAKKDNVTAPAWAFKGLSGEGAIPWLRLVDNGKSSGGVNTVYRVETAGGNATPNCENRPAHWEVPYAAQYWVYGPKS
ncbi:hypothetical protein K491DRAFT_717155 [Lophiostoma macrostomum CBS 122681]|uniref:Malate dehydrogenase n=1 Tax=Lophiostoma macrostomum CBS 122681 TaxID=1314788 RepID=A0A6A6T454_9PLEO|nr:hypothetical protein K491DRAFT_717155 [Lophiostoma macrostomum CBS 122681]